MVERMRERLGRRTKEIVNDALRCGLPQMASPARPGAAYRTASTSLGRCLLASLDDVAETLAVSEGESFR